MQTPNRNIRPGGQGIDSRWMIAGTVCAVVLFLMFGFFVIGPWLKSSGQPHQDAAETTTSLPPSVRHEQPATDTSKNLDVEITEKAKDQTTTSPDNGVKQDESGLTVKLEPSNGESAPDETTKPAEQTSRDADQSRDRSASSGSAKTTYRVQAGAFADMANAESVASKLRDDGYRAQVKQVQAGDRTLYRIQVGEYKTRDDAQRLANDLSDRGYSTSVITDKKE